MKRIKYDRNVRVVRSLAFCFFFSFQNLLMKDIIGIPRLGLQIKFYLF